MALQRLKEAAEKAKMRTLLIQRNGDQPALYHRHRGRTETLVKKLTRAKFEQLSDRLFDACLDP